MLIVGVHMKVKRALLTLQTVNAPAMDVLERCLNQTPGETFVMGAVSLNFGFKVSKIFQSIVSGLQAVFLSHLFLISCWNIIRHSIFLIKLNFVHNYVFFS